MNRPILGVTGLVACLAVVACGGTTTSGSQATARPSPSAGGRRGFAANAAFGQLVQINGTTLILSGTNGDSTVTYASTTTITQTDTETVADITAGSCITATGSKGADGTVTATTVTLSAPVKGSCAPTGFGGGGFGGGAGGSPRPSFSPPAGAAGLTFARGQVKSVSGTAVTITETVGAGGTPGTVGATTTINIPTTVKVSVSTVVTSSALQTGQCLTALGAKDSSGTVAARSLTISPAGANGCTASFGGFGGGGFGGGGFGGGGFGGGAGGTAASA